jgi:hypothetical protein
MGEPRRQQAANRAGANYAYSHQSEPFSTNFRGGSAATPGDIWGVHAAIPLFLSTLASKDRNGQVERALSLRVLQGQHK